MKIVTMQVQKSTMWDVVKGVSTVIAVVALSVKVLMIPTSLVIDFPMLLSLLLALFSVALSALFYFKATDSSNQFYDNTHKFTRDISQLLAKMESGFGERLRNLDEGYTSMRSYWQAGFKPGEAEGDIASKVEEAKQKLQEENEGIKKIVEQRNKIIDDLIEGSQLDKAEKDKVSSELRRKEGELAAMQDEMKRLNTRLTLARFQKRQGGSEAFINPNFDTYTKNTVVKPIGVHRMEALSSKGVRRAFEALPEVPAAYVRDLKKFGLYDGEGLTDEGVEYLVRLAEAMREDKET